MTKYTLLTTLLLLVTAASNAMSSQTANPRPIEDEERLLSYGPSFLRDLCRYVGAPFIRHPADPECKYLWCWYGPGFAFAMDCPPGRTVSRHFYWGTSDPCSERDHDKHCLLGQMEFSHKSERLEVGGDLAKSGSEEDTGKIFQVSPIEEDEVVDEVQKQPTRAESARRRYATT